MLVVSSRYLHPTHSRPTALYLHRLLSPSCRICSVYTVYVVGGSNLYQRGRQPILPSVYDASSPPRQIAFLARACDERWMARE